VTEIAGPNWRRWLREIWPNKKRAIVQSFASIGAEHKLFLADMALRGNVFAPIHETDPILAARAEGKRQLALETIAICNTDPATLFSLVETKPKEQA
jgi:hypothetical protein